MRLTLALVLLNCSLVLLAIGCKFAMKDFNSSVGEIEAVTKGFDK